MPDNDFDQSEVDRALDGFGNNGGIAAGGSDADRALGLAGDRAMTAFGNNFGLSAPAASAQASGGAMGSVGNSTAGQPTGPGIMAMLQLLQQRQQAGMPAVQQPRGLLGV
jgi:hypothetical protein